MIRTPQSNFSSTAFRQLKRQAQHLPQPRATVSVPSFGINAFASSPAGLLQAYTGIRFSGAGSTDPVDNPSPDNPPERMTFAQFMDLVKENPRKYIPTARTYFVQGLSSWGKRKEEILGHEVNVYEFLNKPWVPDTVQDRDEFYGQELVIDQIVETLKELAKKQSPYLIQLVGPNGSGKSQLMNTLQEAMEEFSRRPGGERYTFNIIEVKNNKGRIPVAFPTLASANSSENKYKKLPNDSEITFKLPSALAVNPLFLLSQKERSDLIKQLKADGKLQPEENFDFFINGGDLDKRSQKIMASLRRQYDGNMEKVFAKHIMVERFDFPRVVIPAGENQHAMVQTLSPLSEQMQWSNASQTILNSGALFDYLGYLPRANGGMINIDDMGRSMRNDFTYLLETAQTGRLMLYSSKDGSLEEPVDIIFFSTANPEGLVSLSKQGNFRPLKERTIYLMLPHERRFKNEARVHESQFRRAEKEGRQIAPHVGETYALWATMTRLLKPDPSYKGYKQVEDADRFREALSKVDILKKALLYQGEEDINAHITDSTDRNYIAPADQALLRRNLKVIANEYQQSVGESNYSQYEGAMGISARDGDKITVPSIIKNGEDTDEPITVMDVFKSMGQYLKADHTWMQEREQILEAMQLTSKMGDANNELTLLKQVEDYARHQFIQEVREAVGVYQSVEAHIHLIEKYLEHARAATANTAEEKEVALRFRDDPNIKAPNEKFMRDMESVLFPKVRHFNMPDERIKLLAKFSRDPISADSIRKLCSGELSKMRTYDENTYKARIEKFMQDTALLATNPDVLTQEAKGIPGREMEIKRMRKALDKLVAMGYPEKALPKLLGWAFGKGYISNDSLEVYGSWQ